LSEWPVGGPAHRTGVPGEDPPIAASFPKIDNVEIAAEIPAVRSGFLNLEQADDGKTSVANYTPAIVAWPKRVLALPDLEHAKTAVLNSLPSASGQRTYDHAIRESVTGYCSEPRVAFNRTVVLRYRIHLERPNRVTA